MRKNNIFNNGWTGLDVSPFFGINTALVNNNNIYNNGFEWEKGQGLYSEFSLVDARDNWWGAENGPRCRFHFGDGDKIQYILSLVLRNPWATEPITDAGVQ